MTQRENSNFKKSRANQKNINNTMIDGEIEALYWADSLISTRGHKNILTTWFIADRPYPWPSDPYQDLVLDYGQYEDDIENIYAKKQIDDLFTSREIDLFEAWAKKEKDMKIRKHVKPLPIEYNGSMPISAIPVGGPREFIMLQEYEEFDLPFNVWGYYNLNVKMTPEEFNQENND